MADVQSKPEIVLFDVDGTLIDSEPLHEKSRNRLLTELGVPLFESPSAVAISKEAFWGRIISKYSLCEKAEDLSKREFDILLGIMKGITVDPIDGVRESLITLRENGVRIGTVSSSERKYVDAVLKMMRIDEFFPIISTSDDVKNAKPAPDSYLNALQIAGVSADRAFAVEDSTVGTTAALAAGIRCIGYNAGEKVAVKQDFSLNTTVITDMHDLWKTILMLTK